MIKNITGPFIGDGIELRKAYGEALLELGKKNEDVVVVDSDVSHCTGTEPFEHTFPERFFQIGIAEQNMTGIAAGMATCGLIPFANAFAVFATKRPHDQISISIAYPALKVIIVGAYSGLSSSNTGATHQSIDDISTMRAMPNMTVIAPGDPEEVRQAVYAAAAADGPVYLRLTKSPSIPKIFGNDYKFEIGEAVKLKEGKDVSIISTGVMTWRCLLAAGMLGDAGIDASVVHIPTIKPIDKESIIGEAGLTGKIVTAETHSIIGGLGSAVAEVLSENSPAKLKRIGIRDHFTESASDVEELFKKYGLDAEGIADNVVKFVNAE